MPLIRILTEQRGRLFWVSYSALLLITAAVGLLGGILFGYAIDLPEVDQLQRGRPNIVSYVYAGDGRVLGQFALEKRVLVSYEQIPEHLKQAVLAIEDADFFEHPGIDFQRLFVTIIRDIFLGERKGASTLTMQLSKLLFTSPRVTIERKIKDMLFAIEIEKSFSKEQIFTFYCNQIYLGHGNYGVAAAADFYFNKSLDELSLAESALLAGVIRSPQNTSPINHRERALSRRNLVLQRMHATGFIDAETLQSTIAEPLVVVGKNLDQSPAPYFVELVRQHLERNHSTEQIWEGGLRVYTTLDYDMQVAAQRALRDGLLKFDKEELEWEGAENILDQGLDLETYSHPEWRQIFYEGQRVHGLVLEASAREGKVRLGSYTASIGPARVEWTGRKRVDQALRKGDLAVFQILALDREKRSIEATLDRIPLIQGALIAIENRTGAIQAMVGGFDFQYSKFNRATQALRQPGSIFKPFTYVAAIEAGYSPFDLVLDAPVSFPDGVGRIYAPENSDRQYRGLIPLRDALALSRNVPTIRLANALGIDKVIDAAHRFGLRREFPPYLPVALGAGEITLLEITSAFTVFPNKSVRAKPFFVRRVEDYDGVVLEEHQMEFEEAIAPEVADKMIYLMRSVVQSGTAWRAKVLERPLGGKTGTTNESTDSWFVGFTPTLTAGVWAGYDEKKSLGEKVYGATLALPIWIDFMQEALQDAPVEDFDSSYAPPRMTAVAEEEAETPQERKKSFQVEDIPPPPGNQSPRRR